MTLASQRWTEIHKDLQAMLSCYPRVFSPLHSYWDQHVRCAQDVQEQTQRSTQTAHREDLADLAQFIQVWIKYRYLILFEGFL